MSSRSIFGDHATKSSRATPWILSRPSEVITLRQEIKRLVSEIRGRDEATNRNLKIIEELQLKVIQLNMDNQDMKKRQAYYENLRSPTSDNIIPTRKKKSEQRNISRGHAESKADKKSWQS